MPDSDGEEGLADGALLLAPMLLVPVVPDSDGEEGFVGGLYPVALVPLLAMFSCLGADEVEDGSKPASATGVIAIAKDKLRMQRISTLPSKRLFCDQRIRVVVLVDLIPDISVSQR